MKTRFNKAIDALVHAYFTGTLAKGDCSFCAVGNIVAGAWNIKPKYLTQNIKKTE